MRTRIKRKTRMQKMGKKIQRTKMLRKTMKRRKRKPQ